MKKKIVFVGPPGVGKSTLISLAKKRGYFAVDLEDFSTHDKRLEMIPIVSNSADTDISFFGGADVGSKFPDERVERVLLLPPKDIYLERFRKRDAMNPEKKKQGQKGEVIYDDFSLWAETGVGHYHQIIRDHLSPEDTLQLVIKNLKRKKASKKIADCEFDYWMIFVYVCNNNRPEIALFNCGPYWTTYYSYSNEQGFSGIRNLVKSELGVTKDDSYNGRFISWGHDLTFPWDRSTVVWTSVIRLKDKKVINPTVSRFSKFDWFSKEEAFKKLKGTKFEYGFRNEFKKDSFWECLDN